MKIIKNNPEEITLRELFSLYIDQNDTPIIVWVDGHDINLIIYDLQLRDVYSVNLSNISTPKLIGTEGLHKTISRMLDEGKELHCFENVYEFGNWLLNFEYEHSD